MKSLYYLGVVDYAVLAVSLVIAAAIGLKFRLSNTQNEYFLAGRNMAILPVLLSVVVTLTSAVTMMGVPSEVYKYGLQHLIQPFGIATGIAITCYIFVPVYFQCGVSTVYEFIELRYGKYTRYTISSIFILQTILYMSVVLYAPALALSSVTDLSLNACILAMGAVCTFYCSLGGLKAVLWTDTLQAILMFACFISFYVAGIGDAGGISKIYETAKRGNRLQLFNFSLDPTVRYTFWNCSIRGLSLGFTYGTSQLEVQRMLSMKSFHRAKKTMQLSVIPVLIFHSLCNLAGLVLYSLFYLCDPVLNKSKTGLAKYDQLLPYYIVSRFNSIPGLTGLCIAGIFSGSLSTISSALNSLSTVTVVDFIQPLVPSLNEKKSVYLAKGLCVMYGIFCIFITFTFATLQSIKQMAGTFYSLPEGLITAVFLIGVLTQKPSDKCVFIGILLSFPVVSWIAFGTIISGYKEPYLPLSTSNCLETQNFTTFRNVTEAWYDISSYSTFSPFERSLKDTFVVYKISFVWIPTIGFLCTFFAIYFVVFVNDYLGWCKKDKDVDARCFSPITRLWRRKEIEICSELQSTSNVKLQT